MLVDTQARDTATTIFGHRVAAPIGFAPIGINRIYHATGELSPARVAGELNLPYCLSSAGSYSIEHVAEANDALTRASEEGNSTEGEIQGEGKGKGVRFYQLYWSPDDKVTLSMLERAARCGYTTLILTTDTWQLAWRHDDVVNGNYAFYHEHGAGDLGLEDKAFQEQIQNLNLDPAKDPKRVGAQWIDGNIWHGHSFSWDRLPWLIENWKRISGGKPFVLKGLQSVADARKAVELGVDGIIVSNHAGRQVDGAIASLDALEKIADAVGDKTYVSAGANLLSYGDTQGLMLGTDHVRFRDSRRSGCLQGHCPRRQICVYRPFVGVRPSFWW
jgi:isopentenyl diphosphate isomerase/L-lactate dehydrogenase-like FMN-dependent dehydrogenase